MDKSQNSYFYCYSYNLKEYFLKNGMPFIDSDIHKTTKKRYWVYPSGRMVDILLDEYRKLK